MHSLHGVRGDAYGCVHGGASTDRARRPQNGQTFSAQLSLAYLIWLDKAHLLGWLAIHINTVWIQHEENLHY